MKWSITKAYSKYMCAASYQNECFENSNRNEVITRSLSEKSSRFRLQDDQYFRVCC